METQSKLLSALAVALMLAGLGIFAAQRYGAYRSAHPTTETAEPMDQVSAGNLAAEFKLEDLRGGALALSSMRGKVVFLNVWATWCAPCREEMPSMETLYQDFKRYPDFVMLAVSQDRKGRSVVAPYVEKNGYHFRILLDPQNRVGEAYNVSGVPETFIIDRKGRIVAHHMGAFDWSRPDVRAALRSMLESRDA